MRKTRSLLKKGILLLFVALLLIPLGGSAESQLFTLPQTSANILFAGDILCLAGQLSEAKSGSGWNFGYVFSEIASILKAADFTVGNLEAPIAGAENGVTQYNQVDEQGNKINPVLNAPVEFIDAVSEAGFDMLVTANNHSFDKGDEGVYRTIKEVNSRGIYTSGTYTSPYMHDNTPIVRINDIAVAILAYTKPLNANAGPYRASSDQSKLNLLDITRVGQDITNVKMRGAEYVIAFVHWGNENTHEVSDYQKQTAQELADAGVDMIIGSHPHVVQPVKFIKTTANGSEKEVMVVYSLGNFVSSMPREINNDSFLLNVELERNADGLVSLKEATYLCTTTTTVSGKRFGILPSRQALSAGQNLVTVKASIDRTVNILGDVIKEVDAFTYNTSEDS